MLVVSPLMKAVDFYRKALGFDHPQLLGDPPTEAILERDGFALYLSEAECEVTISPSGGWDVHLRVEDLRAELDALRELGVAIAFGPVERTHGLRKLAFFEIVDPDGYRICIEQQSWRSAEETGPFLTPRPSAGTGEV